MALGSGDWAMKITAAVVPARSAPFEIQNLDLAGPLPTR
jgi:Zn-dependent alcohol dehydrogenase